MIVLIGIDDSPHARGVLDTVVLVVRPVLSAMGRHETLERVVDGGFFCDYTLARDAWFDKVRTHPDFVRIMRRAEVRRREAIAAYLEHGGDHILGVRAGA